MINLDLIIKFILVLILIGFIVTIYYLYYSDRFFTPTKYIGQFTVNFLMKSIAYIIVLICYLFFYYGPKFEKNVQELLNKKIDKINLSKIDILLNYFHMIILIFVCLIIYLSHYNYEDYRTDTPLNFLLEIIFGGLFSLYLVHGSLENYSYNVYDIINQKI